MLPHESRRQIRCIHVQHYLYAETTLDLSASVREVTLKEQPIELDTPVSA